MIPTTRSTLASLALALLCACGARTGLEGDRGILTNDAGDSDSDAAVMDARADGAILDGRTTDVGEIDVPHPGCRSNKECGDGVACTVDRCDLTTGTCSHDPDDALCPPGFVCGPPCAATSFAVSTDFLYGVALPSGAVGAIGSTRGVHLTDIALAPDGTLYGVAESGTGVSPLYTVSALTGVATFVTTIDVANVVALDFATDGTLYGASQASSAVFVIDPTTGSTRPVATIPDGYVASGDLAIVGGGRLFVTANLPPPLETEDLLVAIDLTTYEATLVGSTGFYRIWGLAAYGDLLFGYTLTGQVLRIDPDTASAVEIAADPDIEFSGASAR